MSSSARRVEIVLDLVCVHAYRGFTRLVRAAERHRAEGTEIEVVIRPFQIRPDAPYTGEPLFELHRRERGEAAAREILAAPALGAEDGLEMNLDRALFVNTFEAHVLLARAGVQGLGERMAERLFRAYFADGLHLADPGTLARLAKETGVEARGGGATELRDELSRVRGLGIEAPPVFRFAESTVLEGEQSEEDLFAALKA